MRDRLQATKPTGARAATFETAALYGSLTLISAIVLGTLSLHPF